MGTGPLALDDCLSPVFADEGPFDGCFRLPMATYLARIRDIYFDRPNDGRGDSLSSKITLAGDLTYNGSTVGWNMDAASEGQGYFALTRAYDGGGVSGPGGGFTNYPSCPLKPSDLPEGEWVHEDANMFVTLEIACLMGMSLAGPILVGSNWHDATHAWVGFTFHLELLETTSLVCESGAPAGGSSRTLQTNVIGVGYDDEPPDGATEFLPFGDGRVGLWLREWVGGAEGLRINSGGFV